jgi:thiamine-phosphate pyrophosphorylase
MKKITGGLYLVVDPMPGLQITLPKVKAALEGGVDVIQLWNHWNPAESPGEFIFQVCALSHHYKVPVIIHEKWQWMKQLSLDGVHFDSISKDFAQIKKQIGRPFLAGITCGNDEARIRWAIENKLDYISFCSMFPSSISNQCELVRPELIQQTRALTDMPIYVAGGITCDNVSSLIPYGISGVAVVSGVMKAEDPKIAAQEFKKSIASIKQTLLTT